MRLSSWTPCSHYSCIPPFPGFLDSQHLHVGFGLVVGAMVCFLLLNRVVFAHRCVPIVVL